MLDRVEWSKELPISNTKIHIYTDGAAVVSIRYLDINDKKCFKNKKTKIFPNTEIFQGSVFNPILCTLFTSNLLLSADVCI